LNELAEYVGNLHDSILAGPHRRGDDVIEPPHDAGEDERKNQDWPEVSRPPAYAVRCAHFNSPTSRRTSTRSFFSALSAVSRMSSSFTGSSASGRHKSVMTEPPKLRSPL